MITYTSRSEPGPKTYFKGTVEEAQKSPEGREALKALEETTEAFAQPFFEGPLFEVPFFEEPFFGGLMSVSERSKESKEQFEKHFKAGELEKAKEILPSLNYSDRNRAAMKLFNAYFNVGKLAEAETCLSQLGFSDRSKAAMKVFNAHLKAGNLLHAEEIIVIIGLFDRSLAIERLADEYIRLDKLEDAERVLEAIRFSDSSDRKSQKLFDVYVKRGDWKSAKRIASKMIDRSCIMKVLDHELQSADSLAVMNTLTQSLPMNEKAAQKVADKLVKEKDTLTPENLQQIEKSSRCLWGRAKILILKALITIYQALGNQVEVDRLQERVQKIEEKKNSTDRLINKGLACVGGIFGVLAGVAIAPSNPTAPLIGAAAGALVLGSPTLRKPENALGAIAGVAAYEAGIGIPAVGLSAGAPTAVAVGISTAVGARVLTSPPAKAVLNAGGRALGATMNAIGKGFEASFNVVGKGLEASSNVIEKGFNLGARATGTLVGKTCSVGEKALSGLSKILDVVTLRG